jgi:hypothetical protein
MLNLLLPVLLAIAPQGPAPAPPAEAKSLSFFSEKFPFQWDRLLPLTAEVDGLQIKSIFFNKRSFRSGLLKGADFGTRAQVEVTNTAKTSRNPGFAVAVFDADNRLLAVATGGTKLGSVAPGTTETFDLSFHHVLERLPLGAHFYLSVELAP